MTQPREKKEKNVRKVVFQRKVTFFLETVTEIGKPLHQVLKQVSEFARIN